MKLIPTNSGCMVDFLGGKDLAIHDNTVTTLPDRHT